MLTLVPSVNQVPRVSIVLPAFNSAETLPGAAASLQAQTMTDWQAVIVNDGSTDHTLAIAKEIATRDERFIVLSQANGGVAAARNAALAIITGAYTLLLDADDTLMPKGLEHLLAACRTSAENAGGSYGDFLMTSTAGTPLLLQRGRADVVGLEELLGSVFLAVHAVLTPTNFVKRVMFDSSLPVLEDTDWFLRLAELGVTWQHTSEVVANYRISPSSRSADFDQMLAMTNLVYGASYKRRGLDAKGALQILLMKATVSYLARAALRSLTGGVSLDTKEFEANFAGMLKKFGRLTPLSGTVVGHLTTTACALGSCRRPGLNDTVADAIRTWLETCVRVGIMSPDQDQKAEAWRAIESRLAMLEAWCAQLPQKVSAATV